MSKLLMPFVTPILGPLLGIAVIMLPATANAAAQCRDSASGKYAKCGAPGAVPASQYVAKGKTTKTTTKSVHATTPMMAPAMKTPTATPTKSSMMSMFKPKAKATPAPAGTPLAARCKTAKGKFVKCGTPGAKPA